MVIGARKLHGGLASALALAWALLGASAGAETAPGVRGQIAVAIPEAGALLGPWAYGLGASQALDAVYSANGNAPLWSRDGRATPQALTVLGELKNAEAIVLAYDGVNPLPPTLCYLKLHYLPTNLTWFEQVEKGLI